MNANSQHRAEQRGATLIESLVSILVLSLGLLGMAGLQLNALSFQKSSWAQHRISELAIDIIEKMQSNPAGTNSASYSYTPTYAISASAVLSSNGCRTAALPCKPEKMAEDDLSSWLLKAQQTLPGGAVSISGNSTEGFVVTSMYFDKDFRDPVTNSPSTSQTCAATTSGSAWRTCCPASASVPAGVRCSRVPFLTYVPSFIASPL
jgi:type IV pilus assembly protein PilV